MECTNMYCCHLQKHIDKIECSNMDHIGQGLEEYGSYQFDCGNDHCPLTLESDDTGKYISFSSEGGKFEIRDALNQRTVYSKDTESKPKSITSMVYCDSSNSFMDQIAHLSLVTSPPRLIYGRTINQLPSNCLKRFNGHKDWIRSLKLSDDNCTLLSGCIESVIKAWDLVKLQEIFSVQLQSNPALNSINSLIFLGPDKNRFLIASRDGFIRIRDFRVPLQQYEEFCAHSSKLNNVDTAQNGLLLLSNGRDSAMRLWDSRMLPKGSTYGENSKAAVREFKGFSSIGYNVTCGFYMNEKYAYTGSEDHNMYIYDINSEKIITTKLSPKTIHLIKPLGDSKRLAISGLESNKISFFHPAHKAKDVSPNDDTTDKMSDKIINAYEQVLTEYGDELFLMMRKKNISHTSSNLSEVLTKLVNPEDEESIGVMRKINVMIMQKLLQLSLDTKPDNEEVKECQKVASKKVIQCSACKQISNTLNRYKLDDMPNLFNYQINKQRHLKSNMLNK